MTNNRESEVSAIVDDVESLARSFADHPGFQWTEWGFEVLHADWPAYPTGKGLESAMATFAEFPKGTHFFPIDEVDRCRLFVASSKPPSRKPFDKNLYHIALWDADLGECRSRQLIDGVFVDPEENISIQEMITVTDKGSLAILINELTLNLHPAFQQSRDILYDAHFDTGIREATVIIETRLREMSASQASGQKLLQVCFGPNGALAPTGVPNATRLELNAAFRRLFKYVRNDFAHNLKQLEPVTAALLLRRCSHLYRLAERLKRASSSKAD